MTPGLTLIRILSDGRAGHFNQSHGLAEALQRRTGARIECVQLEPASGFWTRVKLARSIGADAEKPQLVIATGHRTHGPLIASACALGARSVVIMNPTLPRCFFDLCLVPRHDLKDANRLPARVVATRGALNRLPETPPQKKAAGVILLGGPSKHHGWDGAVVLEAVKKIIGRERHLDWTVADSRRTPGGFLKEVAASGLTVTIVPYGETGAGWLPEQLMAADTVWVTADSTSMIFEAITARARVGVLPAPVKRTASRVVRAVDDVIAGGFATQFAEWDNGAELSAPTRPLHEAGRCADVILQRFFSGNTP